MTEDAMFDAAKPEPPPKRTDEPSIHDLVIKDMRNRKAMGLVKYGTFLQASNGRDALMDLYQELLDACAYCRQEMERRTPDAPPPPGTIPVAEKDLRWMQAVFSAARRVEQAGHDEREVERAVIKLVHAVSNPPATAHTFESVAAEIVQWQRKTFPQATPISAAGHLMKEVGELTEALRGAPSDDPVLEELADVFFLWLAVVDRYGSSLDKMLESVRAKLAVNKARTWQKPDANGVVEHVK